MHFESFSGIRPEWWIRNERKIYAILYSTIKWIKAQYTRAVNESKIAKALRTYKENINVEN